MDMAPEARAEHQACIRCHAPLSEQADSLAASLGDAGSAALPGLRAEGLVCAACEPGALKRPEAAPGETALPRVAVAKVDTDTCLPYLGPECGACAESCPVPGAMCWEQGRPRIDPGKCVGCGLCREACILEQKAIHVASPACSAGQA